MKKITLLLLCFTTTYLTSQTEFGAKSLISGTGTQPYRIDSGFIDEDEYPDFVVGTFGSSTIEVFLNDGIGGFEPKTLVTNSLAGIADMKLVDLNDDIFLDILVCGGTKLVWFANNGDGTFSSENTISSSLNDAFYVSPGQIDGNTTIDVMVCSTGANEVLWFSNDGTGTFTQASEVVDNTISRPSVISLKDVDNDGDLDALVSSSIVPSGGSPTPNGIELFINNLVGSGTVSFTKETDPVSENKIYMFDTIFEDPNDFQNTVIFAADFGFGNQGSLYRIEEGGSGYSEEAISTSLLNPATIKLVDMDNDDLSDLVVSSGSGGSSVKLAWLKNNGDGSYASDDTIDTAQNVVYSFTSQDFDLDGDMDIVSIAFSQNEVNFIENLLESLSIPELESNSFRLYPNPVEHHLNFSSTDLVSADVRIVDVTGKIVFHNEIELSNGINTSQLQNGVYILTVNNSANYRFIKN
ncbi:FG-GAP repeat domain-containing protein [Winogradskyella aurantiaca]|uniref:FG-GAP repeat domain-containing protein n=1 Tax=Winogradskyella aurantiaca TaxID=2219558 RepID=UPI000E1DF927|nr:VCBS repeat-containing protein [Winogradskyella aurantiaca]